MDHIRVLPPIIDDNYLATMGHVPLSLVYLPTAADPSEFKDTDVIVLHGYCSYEDNSLMEPHCTHNWYYEEPSDHRFAERNEEPFTTVY